MARSIFIYGRSGSGKSTGIRTLPVESTFIINVNGKELPFKNSQKYITLNTDNYDKINNQLSKVDKEATHIKYVVIDDSQYLMVNHFMKMHSTNGKGNDIFALYNTIGDKFWSLIFGLRLLREDLTVIFLHHAEKDESGFIKPKAIGKMLDDKVDIAGMFTIVLLAIREGKDNFFITQNDGMHQAKSPMGMFKDERIPNDLLFVCETINNYYSEGCV
jgi:AAA domain